MVASDSNSPSAAKPRQVVADWRARSLPIRVLPPTPATAEELSLAHDPAHVRAVLACEAPNGFRTRSRRVARSLPYTTGAMLSAARHVLREGGAACAPCSGFHHALYGRAAAYCTFNGLMVTAAVLRSEGHVRRVGIVDCDLHYGDGTEEIIERLDASSWVRHFTSGPEFTSPEHTPAFFEALEGALDTMSDCDLLLYQAGADIHEFDPYGGWMSAPNMQKRDERVFERARALGIPVVWNLAGGYQEEPDGSIPVVLELHRQTALACIRTFGGRP